MLKTMENVKKNHGGTMGFIRYCPPWELGDWISATPTICELTVCRVKTFIPYNPTCNFGSPSPELPLPVLYPSLST